MTGAAKSEKAAGNETKRLSGSPVRPSRARELPHTRPHTVNALHEHPAYLELRQAVAELSLISHISGTSYEGKIAHDTTEDIGGRRPPGSDRDRPRRPGPEPSESATEAERAAFQHRRDEYESWLVSYQRRTPAYFARELERCRSEFRLIALRDQARETVEAWKRTPLSTGGEPASMADPQWKRWVGETSWSVKQIVNRYGCSRQYVYQVLKAYRPDKAA